MQDTSSIKVKKRKYSPSSSRVNPSIAGRTNTASSIARPPKPKTIIGTNAECPLKAARELKKNRIFYVSNLSKNTDSESLVKWLTDCNIKVNNIFAAKTKFTDSSAFRVNVDF